MNLIMYSIYILFFLQTSGQKPEAGNTQLSVFIFMSETCPICIQLTPEIIKIEDQYSDKVKFTIVFPNSKSSTVSSVENFRKKYNLKSEVLIDHGQKITNEMGASITPEVFVIDNLTNRTIYSGMISDEYIALGKRKRSNVNHILFNVLSDFLSGDSYDFLPNKAVGCFIIKE